METSHSLWNIIEDNAAFAGYTRKGFDIKNAMLFEISSDDEDGTYPRVCDYTRLANAIDGDGVSAYLNRCAKRNKLNFNFMGVKVIRDAAYEDKATIEFAEPINVVFGQIGEERIIKKVKKMKGEFTHEWFWTKRGRQQKIANGFEIWFNVKEYLE